MHCVECGAWFEGKTKRAQFCSDSCRVTAHRKKGPGSHEEHGPKTMTSQSGRAPADASGARAEAAGLPQTTIPPAHHDRAGLLVPSVFAADLKPAYERLVDPRKSGAIPPIPDEETYVQRELAITRYQMQTGKLKDAVDTKGRNRIERAEAYARWRYASFLSGEVASL